jgi:hypothetical protein
MVPWNQGNLHFLKENKLWKDILLQGKLSADFWQIFCFNLLHNASCQLKDVICRHSRFIDQYAAIKYHPPAHDETMLKYIELFGYKLYRRCGNQSNFMYLPMMESVTEKNVNAK